MITYELAKQLKDAGFKQYGDGKRENEVGLPILIGMDFNSGEYGNYCYFPTLSELIEACGDRFYGVLRGPFKKYWEAGEYWGYAEFCGTIGQGSTPEEAVANLWLELNKKD